jgi:HEAT repeat protein
MFRSKHLLAAVLLAGLPLSAFPEAASKPKPLSEADVLKLIELQRQTEAILARLNKAGVDFPVNEAVLERLRKAGASEKVLDALRRRPNAPRPVVKEPMPEVKSPLVKALIEQLTDKDGKVRRTAAETLGKLGAKEAVPALIERVADDVWVQHPGIVTFGDSTPYDGHQKTGSKDRALQALSKLAPEKVRDALLLALKSKSYQVRRWAARELAGQKKSAAIVAALVEGLRDADGSLRRAAADSLGKLGAKEAVPALIERVADDVWVQHPGIVTFGDSTPYDGNKKTGSKDRALQALSKLAPEKVRDALLLALKSKKPAVKAWALAELGKVTEKK